MSQLRPKLRRVEMLPADAANEGLYVLRDPEGLGQSMTLPDGAALLVLLMDGRRTVPELQAAFREEVGVRVQLEEIQALIEKLDAACLLHGPRFQQCRRRILDAYLQSPVRPALYAGSSYAEDPVELAEQLAAMFASRAADATPDPSQPRDQVRNPPGRLVGALCPHIDLYRGEAVYADIYRRIAAQSDADLYVIFGTAHRPMRQWFSVSRKHFATPLGQVETDQRYIEILARHVQSSLAGRMVDLFDDELVQRVEHSIEFQALLLRHVLGPQREFRMVPILVNSLREFMDQATMPDDSPEIQAFLTALRDTAAEYPGRICYLGAADLAHVGQEFGDDDLLDPAGLDKLARDDHRLLSHAAHCDANAFYQQVALQGDCNRICGLAPGYLLLQAVAPAQGHLVRYGQATEPDGTACVSFAGMAFYGG